MPFDPNQPQQGELIDAVQLRNQFNGLKTLIDNVPAGPPGPPGPQGDPGPPFAHAVVDNTATLPPNTQATVSSSFDGITVHFDFGIPRGADGPPGEVTTAQLANAIMLALESAAANSSANSNGVAESSINPSDPPTAAQFLELQSKLNQLIVALRR